MGKATYAAVAVSRRRWYVWPGRGARRLGKYGPLRGKSFLVG
jgi:hypothetical protein